MEITNQPIQDYISQHTFPEPKLLQQLRKETHQKTIQPHMLSGAYQGRLLSLISKIAQPNNILEIGTFTGYSALCLAEGLNKNGTIITIDKNDELEHLSSKYFTQSNYSKQIQYINGNALEIIPTLQNRFDLIFIDADKSNYINYYELCLPLLNSNGILLADNVLWYGKVIEPTQENDTDTATLKEFNQLITKDQRVESVILPIRDGIGFIRKK